MEITDEQDISMLEAKHILEDRKKARDLVYEQKICLEYLEKMPKITQTQLKSMIEELQQIAILKPRYVALIINMLPDTEPEVEALFSKERTNLKKEEVKKIVEIVKSYKK